MKALKLLAVLFVFGFFFISCSGGSSDDGGTTGGSGETSATTATEDSSTKDVAQEETKEETKEETAVVNTSSEIWLDAFDFNCTGNWGDRDGALGILAYQGSGSCTMDFPGETGTYEFILKAQTEYDGRSPYKLFINGTQVAGGEYPLSSDLYCDCPHDNWREVCPDRNVDISLGTHTINNGATLKFWGDDVYPCGEHGSYTKWHGITAIKR